MIEAEGLLAEIRTLLDAKQWKSASFLAGVLVSKLSAQMRVQTNSTSKLVYIDALIVYADALVGGGELRRALAHYSAALTWMKSHKRLGSTSNYKPSTSECFLRLKIAEAYLQLNEHPKALEHLEKIELGPNAVLDNTSMLSVYMQRANCYKRRGSRDAAIENYKNALENNPYCMEAILGLLEMLPTQVPQTTGYIKRLYFRPETEWAHKWLDLLKNKLCGNYVEALRVAGELLQDIGDYNTSIVLEVAECHYRLSQGTEAIQMFAKVVVHCIAWHAYNLWCMLFEHMQASSKAI